MSEQIGPDRPNVPINRPLSGLESRTGDLEAAVDGFRDLSRRLELILQGLNPEPPAPVEVAADSLEPQSHFGKLDLIIGTARDTLTTIDAQLTRLQTEVG